MFHWMAAGLGEERMCPHWPVLFFSHILQMGLQAKGMSAPGPQRHQRTGRLCPFHPGTGQRGEGEAVKLALPKTSDRKLSGSELSVCFGAGRHSYDSWLQRPPRPGCLPSQGLGQDGMSPGP